MKDVSRNSLGDQVLDTNKNGTVCCSEDAEGKSSKKLSAKHPGNFMELVEMLQKGMSLPDTEDLDIEPLNEEPTPCNKQRPKKPWEETWWRSKEMLFDDKDNDIMLQTWTQEPYRPEA